LQHQYQLPACHAVGYFYRNFHQIGDEEVIATLKRFPTNRVVHASDGS